MEGKTPILPGLDDMDIDSRRVLTRIDINVPVRDGTVSDPTRIERVAPTIRHILDRGGRPVLISHLGRPKGRVVDDMSLEVTVPTLATAIGAPVTFVPGLPGKESVPAVNSAGVGEVLLLENLRFVPGEEANDPDFSRELAMLGDVYCNDAFSTAHRAHASTAGVAGFLPACAGDLMRSEINALSAALDSPKRPFIACIGGAKISTKLELLDSLARKVDGLVIGGGMANTFLAAQGHDVGRSLCEPGMADAALKIMETARQSDCTVTLPRDVVVATGLDANSPSRIVSYDGCGSDEMILDLGPDSIKQINSVIDTARTLIWNGPMGAFEIPPFDRATLTTVRHAAERSAAGMLTTVAGGGDTIAALNAANAADMFSYVSTAGGAFLEWVEGKALPGIEALMTRQGDRT